METDKDRAFERPGATPREALLVRQWGIENGWREVAARWEEGGQFPTVLDNPPAMPRYEPTEADRDRGFVLFAPDRNVQRPFNQPPTPEEAAGALRALTFPGERESLVVGLWALRDLEETAVSVSSLEGPGGAIDAGPSWNEHNYWTPGYAEKTVAYPGVVVRDLIYAPLSLWSRVQSEKLFTMWPLWLVAHEPEPMKAGDVRLFWLTVHTPPDLLGGEYCGTVTVGVGRRPAATGPITLDVQPFALDTSLCSWVPVTGTNGFPLTVYQQMAEHHLTGLSWWWDDWGLTVTRDGDRASFDPRPLDLLNAVTREAGMRGPWILLIGSMGNGQLERRIASSGLFDVSLIQRPKSQPDAPPTVGDLADREMDRRYVEVLQALAARAREKDYPEIILIVYDEPTNYLFDWHAQRSALIHRHVPGLKTLATPQAEYEWAKNLLTHCDYMDVFGADDPIYDLVREAGKRMAGFHGLGADRDFAQARWNTGLRFAENQPPIIYFWGFNYGGLDGRVPFNDLVTPQNWGFRHRIAWPPAGSATLEPSLGDGRRWIETPVWEAQREGAKDQLLVLMLEQALAFVQEPEADRIRRDFADLKHDAARHPTDLDDRRRRLVHWYRALKG